MAPPRGPTVEETQDEIKQDGGPERQRVCVFDGGGVRLLSTLLILIDIWNAIEIEEERYDSRIRPRPQGYIINPYTLWGYFDLCSGSDTGALIAIMLGRLRMTFRQALTAFKKLETVFEKLRLFHSSQYSLEKLQQWATELVQSYQTGSGDRTQKIAR